MADLTIELSENEYQRIQRAADTAGKSVKKFIEEWIVQLPSDKELSEVTNDPLFTIEGYDSAAPLDYSLQIDRYLYQDSKSG